MDRSDRVKHTLISFALLSFVALAAALIALGTM